MGTRLAKAVSLARRLETFSFISFDIFDTAILRRVARPEQALAVAARHDAEARARAELDGSDPDLDAIYGELELPRDWDGDALRALEIETELRLCVRNEFIHALYSQAVESGKTVVFATDMYLPESVIAQILDGAGYRGYRKLYISSALPGESKWNGKLYERIVRELNIAPNQLLHVGDNPWSDVLAAARAGVVPAPYARPAAPPDDVERAESPNGAVFAEWFRAGLAGLRRAARHDGRAFRFGYERAGLWGLARAERTRLAHGGERSADAAVRALESLPFFISTQVQNGVRAFAEDFLPLLNEYPWIHLPEAPDIAIHRLLYYWLVA